MIRPVSILPRVLLAMLAAGLTACASYEAAPLPQDASPRFADLQVDRSHLPFPDLAAYPFDPSDGLDSTELAMLAVANNPGLRLARDDAGISHAQAFAAGLLPNPTLSYGMDFPQHSPGATTAFNAGVGYDLGALVAHAAIRDAGRAEARSADLNLLWQEWQVVAQARLLSARILSQEKLQHWLEQSRDLALGRRAASNAALKAGDISLDAASTALLAAQDAERQFSDMERQSQTARADLNALLGLAPGTHLSLVEGPELPPADDAHLQAALSHLDERPDLQALRSGYAAQDARYRQAILAQFPPLSLGLSRARDNSGITSTGFAISLSLPIFDRNQGAVAVEKATRQRLFDEYQFRLNGAREEVARLQADMKLELGQLQKMDADLPSLDAAAIAAKAAFSRGDLDGPGYASFVTTDIQKHIDRETLAAALAEQKLALLTLVGGDFAAVGTESKP